MIMTTIMIMIIVVNVVLQSQLFKTLKSFLNYALAYI